MSVPENKPNLDVLASRVLQHFMHETSELMRNDTEIAAHIQRRILTVLQDAQANGVSPRDQIDHLQTLFASMLHDYLDTMLGRALFAMQQGDLPPMPPEFRTRDRKQ